jgi:hypothetical protein
MIDEEELYAEQAPAPKAGASPQPFDQPNQLPTDDPFAASNFAAAGEEVPTSIDDLTIELGAPNNEDFVYVSSDPRHYAKAYLLVVQREGDGFGKSYFLLSPSVTAWVKGQPSLKKFLKVMHIYLYKANDGGYGLWPIRDSLDNWSVSELQVVNQAKKLFTRRFTEGKVRKGHASDALDTATVVFPDKSFTGSEGIFAQTFGEAFTITSTDHPVLNRLLGKQ